MTTSSLWCDDAEPALSDMLGDPIIHAVMRRDRVSQDDILAAVVVAQVSLAHERLAFRHRSQRRPMIHQDWAA